MKFVFVFLGKTREKYLAEGIEDYAGRLGRFVQVEFIVIKENFSKKNQPEIQMKKEAALLLEKCTEASYVVALDPSGKMLESETLAENIVSWENRGLQSVYFLIGGHCGLHRDVLHRADLILSLSRMTFTHEMTRLVLMEQLYRGCMIKTGRSYHY